MGVLVGSERGVHPCLSRPFYDFLTNPFLCTHEHVLFSFAYHGTLLAWLVVVFYLTLLYSFNPALPRVFIPHHRSSFS